MSLTKFLDPKNDYAFKRIFGKPKNEDILIHFLNDMLRFNGEKSIKTVSFLPTDQNPEIAAAKQSSVDVICTDEDGRQYIVEMQVVKGRGFEKRAQYYAAKAYSRQLMEGDRYHKLKEIIFLAITNFVMFPDKIDYKSDHVILDKKTHDHDLKDFSFTFLELPKFHKSIDELSGMVEKWSYFFKHAEDTAEDDLAKIIGSDAIIKRAYEELNRYSWTETELNTYEQEEKRELDAIAIREQQLETGRAEGRAEGEAIGEARGEARGEAKRIQEKREMVKKMMKLGVAIEVVIDCTGLAREEINAIMAGTTPGDGVKRF